MKERMFCLICLVVGVVLGSITANEYHRCKSRVAKTNRAALPSSEEIISCLDKFKKELLNTDGLFTAAYCIEVESARYRFSFGNDVDVVLRCVADSTDRSTKTFHCPIEKTLAILEMKPILLRDGKYEWYADGLRILKREKCELKLKLGERCDKQ